MIRTVWVVLVVLVLTGWHGGQVLWAAWRRSAGLPRIAREVPRRWARRILTASGVSVEIEGSEGLDRDGSQVFVANHDSWYDVLVLTGYLPTRLRFVAKKELATIPVFGPACQACGHIAIDRQDRAAAIQSLERTRRQLDGDRSATVIIFPEGTRSESGELGVFKKGAFVLAIQAGAPVVPAAIIGSRDVLPKSSWRITPGPIKVRIGKPIPVTGVTLEERDDLTRRARAAVQALRDG